MLGGGRGTRKSFSKEDFRADRCTMPSHLPRRPCLNTDKERVNTEEREYPQIGVFSPSTRFANLFDIFCKSENIEFQCHLQALWFCYADNNSTFPPFQTRLKESERESERERERERGGGEIEF